MSRPQPSDAHQLAKQPVQPSAKKAAPHHVSAPHNNPVSMQKPPQSSWFNNKPGQQQNDDGEVETWGEEEEEEDDGEEEEEEEEEDEEDGEEERGEEEEGEEDAKKPDAHGFNNTGVAASSVVLPVAPIGAPTNPPSSTSSTAIQSESPVTQTDDAPLYIHVRDMRSQVRQLPHTLAQTLDGMHRIHAQQLAQHTQHIQAAVHHRTQLSDDLKEHINAQAHHHAANQLQLLQLLLANVNDISLALQHQQVQLDRLETKLKEHTSHSRALPQPTFLQQTPPIIETPLLPPPPPRVRPRNSKLSVFEQQQQQQQHHHHQQHHRIAGMMADTSPSRPASLFAVSSPSVQQMWEPRAPLFNPSAVARDSLSPSAEHDNDALLPLPSHASTTKSKAKAHKAAAAPPLAPPSSITKAKQDDGNALDEWMQTALGVGVDPPVPGFDAPLPLDQITPSHPPNVEETD